ncbi:Alternative oxidase 1a, mitochondrial [Hordeum vulgare]|nr:Alternative oxidase 1a, mitochondrial [Hordeum vulgare]
MTTATGGVAPVPSRAAASPSKLFNAARPKKGKTSGKKNKAADGSDSSKARGKKLAGRRTGATATEAPASSLVEPAADAHHVFDEISSSLNDHAYMSTMGVGSNNSHWSQTNDIHIEDHEFEVDEEGEGIVNAPKGRAGNYTTNDDKLLCNTWLQVSRNPSVGGDQSRDAYWGRMKEYFDAQNYNIAQNLFEEETRTTKKGKITKGKIFTLHHCSEVLKDDEKWKKREDLDDLHLSNKRKRTIELNDDDEEDDASSDDGKRSPTPNSVSYSKPKRPDGCKKDKTKKKKRKGDDELTNAMEAIVKEYVNLAGEEVLIQKRAMIRTMGGGGLGAMGGGGLGAMGGMGAPPAAMGGMGGFGAPSDAMAVMGGMSVASLMGGMGAPPAMGGISFDVPPHTHSHEDAVEDLANIVRTSRDAVRDEVREEDSSSEAEESSSEDEDEDEEDDD